MTVKPTPQCIRCSPRWGVVVGPAGTRIRFRQLRRLTFALTTATAVALITSMAERSR